MLKVIIAASLVGLAAAECPNACSGHGTCSKFDMCTCYSNWQGNDCSQRTCPFDLAHVDTPKGDLNGDLKINGVGGVNEDDLVLVGSTVYPKGTFEGFPATAAAQSAHFYMECANKGVCDRTTGECACFDGYEGTACQRASCPNDCSGHGTCETIEELSGSVAYKLWDRQATMGCKCDSGYGTADCSERACKYGVDPLYIDDTVGRFTEVSLTMSGSGSFAIVFYDVHGEDYETGPIPFDATCDKVQRALVALPNDVIKCDLAAIADADTNAVAILDSCIPCSGTVVSGDSRSGVLTLGFPNNPGYLRPLEIITNRPGVFGTGATVVVKTVNIGEFADHFASNCGVAVTLGTDKVTTASAAKTKVLKKCLGDSDGNEGNNVDVENWDTGAVNPHAIKTVSATGTVKFGLIKSSATANEFTTLSTISGTGDVSVFATDGVATWVVAAASGNAKVEVTVANGAYKFTTGTINTSCDGGTATAASCLKQGDSVFVFDATGPVHMYTIVRISTLVSVTSGSSTATSYEIEVDYPIAATGTTGAFAKLVRFDPSVEGSYEYVSQCSNRGTCDTSSGLCQCFKGYTGDDCATQSALAV